jgi:hypothetical protein
MIRDCSSGIFNADARRFLISILERFEPLKNLRPSALNLRQKSSTR